MLEQGTGSSLKTRRRRGKSTPSPTLPTPSPSRSDIQAEMDERVQSTGIIDALAFPGNELVRFGTGMYEGADETVRSLLELFNPENTYNPVESVLLQGPELIEGTIDQTIENWSNPMEYANENPFGFMLDLVGGAATGAKALDRIGGLERLIGEEIGAIGPVGHSLEGGWFDDAHPTGRGMGKVSASDPEWAEANFPGLGRQPVIIKEGSQANMDRIANELFRKSDPPFPYAGIGKWEYQHPGNPGQSAADWANNPRVLIEPIPDFNELKRIEQMNPEFRGSLGDISLADAALGNSDRNVGHNLGVMTGGQPIPYDFGIWGRQIDPTWNSILLDTTLKGSDFSPEQIEWLRRLGNQVSHHPSLIAHKKDIVIERINRLLNEPTFDNPLFGKPMYPSDAFGPSSSSSIPFGQAGRVIPNPFEDDLSSLSYATGETTGSAERAWLERMDAQRGVNNPNNSQIQPPPPIRPTEEALQGLIDNIWGNNPPKWALHMFDQD